MIKTILICTVGGSHQPIISAINELQPDYVVFICTDKDPATGRPGSNIQINGAGNCIKAHPQDEKPSLSNIPQQTVLNPDQYRVICTLSDDIDQIYLDCSQAIAEVHQQYPEATLVADYTGGTKSMSAGLVVAVLENPAIELQLVTGSRADLIKVHDGAQASTTANIEKIRFQRMLSPFRQCWKRYAYSEAEAGLKTIKSPRDNQLRSQLNKFRELSYAFAEWDNFNHVEALLIIQRYAPSLSEGMKPYIANAMRLNDNNPKKQDAAKLHDLYLNSLRRAHQGRYDDAIARIYRLIEWTAQWILRYQCHIETANVPEAEIPAQIQLVQNREQQWQAGLFNAWQLIKYKTKGAAADFIRQQENNLQNQIKMRNQSILAHGFEPVSAENWQEISLFMQEHFMPMLLAETVSVGIKTYPTQLPACYE